MHNTNKERELRVNGSNANNKMCFKVRAPSSTSPPSPRRISNLLTCPPRTPTKGTSTEDFGQIQPGVPNSSLNQYNLHRGNTNTIHLYRRGIQIQTNSTSPRGSKSQPQPLPKREHPTIQINLYQRGISQSKGLQLGGYKKTTNYLFSHKTKDPIE